jgi:hypothetical protein
MQREIETARELLAKERSARENAEKATVEAREQLAKVHSEIAEAGRSAKQAVAPKAKTKEKTVRKAPEQTDEPPPEAPAPWQYKW